MEINDGEIFGIIGQSGAGKSTLLQILGSLSSPDSGTLVIDGVDVAALKGVALADFRNRCLDTQGELSKLNDFEKMAYLLCICNCDESGNLLQSAEDYKAVADNLSPTVLNELVDQIYKTADISGDAAKN